MQRVFRVVNTSELKPVGLKTTQGFNHNVRDNGVITPILVAEVPDADGVIALEIIDGNRRVRAAKQAGIDKVPAVVLRETTPEERARLTLICNHLRSLNFFTESQAALALADDDRGLEREARLMGLSVSKVLGMVHKLERMPEAVRTAMWEERLQVSSATDIAGFPTPLQDEVVARLEQRGWLDTRIVTAMKVEWEARHGTINPRSGSRSQRQAPSPAPPAQWEEAETVSFDDGPPSTTLGGWQVRSVETPRPQASSGPSPSPGSIATIPRPTMATPLGAANAGRHEVGTARAGVASRSAPESDAHLVEMEAFVKVLDATLRDLAREGKSLGIGRSVWVDRTMRAWDQIGG